jgi:hypothetical protein
MEAITDHEAASVAISALLKQVSELLKRVDAAEHGLKRALEKERDACARICRKIHAEYRDDGSAECERRIRDRGGS